MLTDHGGICRVDQRLLTHLQLLQHNILLGRHIQVLYKAVVQMAGGNKQSIADLLHGKGLTDMILNINNGSCDNGV